MTTERRVEGRGTRAALAVVVLVAVLVTALFAGSTTAAARDAQTVSVKVWSASVCKGFATWEHRLTKLGATDATDAADPADAKTAIVKFLTGAEKATGRLAKALERAGVPSVTDGEEIAATFVSSVEGLRASYVDATAAAAALPIDDPAAALALAAQLQAAEASLHAAVTEAAQKHPAKKLDEAFATTRACTDPA